MPAAVDSAFTVRGAAWWDLTGQYDRDENPSSIQEAQEWAGLLWEPQEAAVFRTRDIHKCESKEGCSQPAVAVVRVAKTGKEFYACGKHSNKAKKEYKDHVQVTPLSLKQMPGYFSVVRSDNGTELAVANSTYEIFSNRETFELVEMLLDPDAGEHGFKVKFETGGALKGGKMVWALARLDEPMEVVGANGARDTSPIYPFVSVLNSHDGSAALRAINTSVRIVCWNTWSAAESEAAKNKRQFTFRHTASIRDRVDAAREVLMGARDDTAEWIEYANRAIAIPITDNQFDAFLKEFIPMEPGITDRAADNVLQARKAVEGFYHSESCASIAGTVWGAIQATGEFLDHGRTYRSKESYVGRQLLRPEDGKNKAMRLIHNVTDTEHVLKELVSA